MKSKLIWICTLFFITLNVSASDLRNSDIEQLSSHERKSIQVARAEFNASRAAAYLKESALYKSQIVAQEGHYQNLAIMSAIGRLNTKFADWGKSKIEKGELSEAELYKVLGVSLMSVTELAQAAGLYKAAQCHTEEAMVVMKIGRGEKTAPANCRSSAYSADYRANAISVAYGEKGEQIHQLANQWATSSLLFGYYSMLLDRKE